MSGDDLLFDLGDGVGVAGLGVGDGDGVVRVEARRGGMAHKGQVLLREGSIADVRLRDGYDAFP